jgi:tetratricopeptide (TPR) repeat protein
MVKKISTTVCFLVFIQLSVWAQVDFNRQYFNAKQLFREGKYNLAMESFKPLIPYDQNNNFSEYASFYYALSAYHQGYMAVAKDQLNQIKSLHPKWDKIDEVNFWLGKIHFENRDYFQGLKVFSALQDKKFQKDIEALKVKALSGITDLETLRMMHEEYPKDEVVVRALAKALSRNLSNEEDKKALESLIDNFKLKREEFIPEAPKTFHKDVYSVSVLMPFMVNTLEPSPAKKRNQIVLDFYEGMKLATDTLEKQGTRISLRAYDTERNVRKIQSILNSEELKNTDLMVGPFFQDENKTIQDFSLANRINVVNPFSNNSEIIGDNPYAFLFQPSLETMGKKSGEFLASYAIKKNCMVFYGTSKRDSVLAANFIKSAGENGLKVVGSHRVTKETTKGILTLLATPTEYDEFRYPKEFTLKKDSVGSIFVATDDALIYTKVVSGIETRGDGIIVLGSENWLDQTVVDLEKYQTLPIVLAAPNYTSLGNPNYRRFVRKFIRTHGRVPSDYAKMGYEFMLLMGNQLKKYGVYFQEGLNEQEVIPGVLNEGYNFQFSRNNQLIPFIRFEGGELKVIEKR